MHRRHAKTKQLLFIQHKLYKVVLLPTGSLAAPLLSILILAVSHSSIPINIPLFAHLGKEDVVQRRSDRQADGSPAGADDLLVLEAETKIPRQMPEAVVRVEEEGEGEEALDAELNGEWPGGDGGNHRLRLEVPSGVGGGQVGEAEDVERAAEGDSSDTVQGGSIPGDLGLVDGQVGGDGAVQALLVDNLLGLLLGSGFGGGEPALHDAASGLDAQTGGGGPAQAELEEALRSHCV